MPATGKVAAKSTGARKGHGQQKPSAAAASPQNKLVELQRAAGNAAVGQWIGGGYPLDPSTRASMEKRFQHNFSNVRIYTGPRAAESAHLLKARAFTAGSDVVFSPGAYAPFTDDGKRLLAHELAHVVQQSRGGRPPDAWNTRSLLEFDAHNASRAALHASGAVQVNGASAPGITRQEEANAAQPDPVEESIGEGFTRRKCSCGASDCPSCSRKIQTKLKVGPPADHFEREADSVADQVMRMPAPHATPGRYSGSEASKGGPEPGPIQRKSTLPGLAAPADAPPLVQNVLRSPGQPLDPSTQSFMESAFGNDFGQVRIHNDPLAARSAGVLDAKAYAYGHHVVFGTGEYVPGSAAGGRLLAHELTHVVQQTGGRTSPRIARKPLTELKFPGDVLRQDDEDSQALKLSATRKPVTEAWIKKWVLASPCQAEAVFHQALSGSREFEGSAAAREIADHTLAGELQLLREQRQGWCFVQHELRRMEELTERVEWIKRGVRAAPGKDAQLLMPEEAQEAEELGPNSPVRARNGAVYRYGRTLGRYTLISADSYGGGIVKVNTTGYYYYLPEALFRDTFGRAGVFDKAYEDTKHINVLYGKVIEKAATAGEFFGGPLGQIMGPFARAAGKGMQYDIAKINARKVGDEFNEEESKIGWSTAVESASNLVGGALGGKIEGATGSQLAGVVGGMYSGGIIQKGYEAATGKRSLASVFLPPSLEEIGEAWITGKIAGYAHGGWTTGRTPKGSESSHPTPEPARVPQRTEERPTTHSEPARVPERTGERPTTHSEPAKVPERTELPATHQETPPKARPSEDTAMAREVHAAAEEAGSLLPLRDGLVHGVAAAGEGKAARMEFCSPDCSLARRKLGKIVESLPENTDPAIVRGIRFLYEKIGGIDKELAKGAITKRQANTRAAEVARELKQYAGKDPEVDKLLQMSPAEMKPARAAPGRKPKPKIDSPEAAGEEQPAKKSRAPAKPRAEKQALDPPWFDKATLHEQALEQELKDRPSEILQRDREISAHKKQLESSLKEQPKIPDALGNDKDFRKFPRVTGASDEVEIDNRLEAVRELKEKLAKENKLTPDVARYLDWEAKKLTLQKEIQGSRGANVATSEQVKDIEQVRQPAAAEDRRQASQSIYDLVRKEGPNYRDKTKNIQHDEITGKPSRSLHTEHLYAVVEIAQLPQLNEFLKIYARASQPIKALMRESLSGLGDLPINLKRIQSGANLAKGAKSWEGMTYDMLKDWYTPPEVVALRTAQDVALKTILDEAARLTTEYRNMVDGGKDPKPSPKAPAPGKVAPEK